jgi:hypothetical protein
MISRALRRACFASTSAVLLLLQGQVAQAADPGAARVQLQQGYTLKQAGNCKDAIPYFVESIRLDRQPKALIHLADCERDTGKYVAAEQHLVTARDLGREQGASGLVTLAEARLVELETHLPRLTIRLGSDAPADAVVMRDGVVLAPLSLGIALPLDPGAHQIRVRGGGLEREYALELHDSESKELQVTSVGGQAVATPELPAAPNPAADSGVPKTEAPAVAPGSSSPSSVPAQASSSSRSTRRTLGFVVVGTGVAGVVVGGVFGLQARSKSKDADGQCTASNRCTDEGVARYHDTIDDAKSARTVSFIGLAAGGALLAAGGVLLVTSLPTQSQGLRIAPAIGANTFGAAAQGVW